MRPTDERRIAYRQLDADEVGKLREIDRSEIVEAVYYVREGRLVLVPERRESRGFDNIDSRIASLAETRARGGLIFGAFDGSTLVGMSVLENGLRGAQRDRMQMSGLWVSRAYRRRGVGGRLVEMAGSAARSRGAAYLYISATPSENTVRFYLGIGCKLAEEVDSELFAMEPEDVHLELALHAQQDRA